MMQPNVIFPHLHLLRL